MIRPCASIQLYHPGVAGVETVFGLSRDWRPNSEWACQSCEYIEPLGAIGPSADFRPRDMYFDGSAAWSPGDSAEDYAWWTLGTSSNDAFRTAYASGSRASRWIEYMDGGVYAAGQEDTAIGLVESPVSIHGYRKPNFAFHLARYTPPASQGIRAGVSVMIPAMAYGGAAWDVEAFLSLVIPDGDEERPAPFLHYITQAEITEAGTWTYWANGELLSQGLAGGQMAQGPQRETYLFEVIEPPSRDLGGGMKTYQGTHIIIRRAGESGEVWHTYAPGIRFIPSTSLDPWRIYCQGQVCAFNLTLLRYGERVSKAHPKYPLSIPVMPPVSGEDESVWEHAVEYGTVTTLPDATGWSVAPASHPEDDEYHFRPVVTFTRNYDEARHDRPVLWFATEDHDTTIGSSTAGSWSSDGLGLVRGITYTQNSEWRGSEGRVTFYPHTGSPSAYIRENALCEVTMGWDSAAGAGIAAAKVATAYVLPGGAPFSRDGRHWNGTANVQLKLGDFSLARMPQKERHDRRQAGGRNFLEWAQECCEALGLPTSVLDVDADLSALTIPLSALPSEPAYDDYDGTRWDTHLNAVCAAMGARWGFDKNADGHLFFDTGRPAWNYPTTSVTRTLSYDTSTDHTMLRRIERTTDVAQYRNLLKVWTPSGAYYIADSITNRVAFGDTWSAAPAYEYCDNPAQVAWLDYLERQQWHVALSYSGPLWIDVRPDDFVGIGTVPDYMGFTTGEVYQVVRHTMTVDAETGEGTSDIEAVLVSG